MSSINSTEKSPSALHVKETSSTSKETPENVYKVITSRDADATLRFQEEYDPQVPEITPEQESKLSRKVCWIVVPLVSLVNLILYMDKATLSYASILGLFKDTGLDQDKYSTANTLFYVGFLIAQVPGNYLLQKLPLSKYLLGIVISWSAIILLTCTVHNYQGIYAVRFFLGFTESVVISLLNLTMGQFLTAKEKAASAPIFYSTCLGVTIPAGFIAYGALYIDPSVVAPWKAFMIIIGGLTLSLSVLIWFVYPDNPSNAKFLTIEERIWVIRRVQRTTGAGIEQKVFKKYQFIEAFKDPITYLFVLYIFFNQLANNLPYQQNLLFVGIGGISSLDSTLVSVAAGGFAAICCVLATLVLSRYSNITAFSIVFWNLPSLVGSIVAVALPYENKIGLLAAISLACPAFGVPFILVFSWNITSCSGYTKKITRNGTIMAAFCVANLISPQLWRKKDEPRFVPAWIVQIVLSFGLAPVVAMVIWYILKTRNEQRLAELEKDGAKVGIVEDSDKEFVVNIASLDLTDLENRSFIYPL